MKDEAFAERCRRLNLGQTAYWGKQQIGGIAEEEFLYFKAVNPVLHKILRRLRRILFPQLRLPLPATTKFSTMPRLSCSPARQFRRPVPGST